MQKTGRILDKLCTLCAVLFCALIVVQNLLFVGRQGQWFSLAGLILSGLAVLLLVKYAPETRYFPLILFLARFACALGVILFIGTEPIQDFNTMYSAACQLAQGSHDYLYLDTCYFYNWAYQTAFVVYEAAVIRLFGEGYFALQILNALYLSGTAVLVYAIAKRLLPGKGGMAAGLLYLFYPAPLFLAAVLTNQHLSVFLLYLGVWVLLGKDDTPSLPRAAIAGLLFALGNAVRPIGVIALLAGLLWCVIGLLRNFRRDRGWLWTAIARPVVLTAVYVLVGAALSGLIVWSGANPNGLTNNQPMWKFVLGFCEESSGMWNAEDYQNLYLLQGDEADAAMRETVKERLSVGPVRLAKLMLRKCSTMWASNEYMTWGFGHLDHSAPLVAPLRIGQAVNLVSYWDKGTYLLLFLLTLGFLVRQLLSKNAAGRYLFPILLFCGYFAVHLLIEVQSRYRYFLMPTIAVLAGLMLAELIRGREKAPDPPI